MTSFLRNIWRAWNDERTQRWLLLPFAAVSFLGVFANTASGWRLWCLTFGVLYTFAAGWLWSNAVRARQMHRRHAITVEGPTWEDAQEMKSLLEWFAAERKAGRR